jgi:uncharacterized membrane protein
VNQKIPVDQPGRLEVFIQSHARQILAIMVILWAILLAAYAIARHERLNSSAFDLAIKSQVIWNSYQGRLFSSSIEVEQYLGDHVQLIMLLIAPLFAVWENVNILLILQAVVLSLGAVPVFRIAKRNLNDSTLALLFAAIYLLYPSIAFVNRFDFHPITFAILFLLLAVDFVEIDRPYLASLFVLLALMTREEVGLTVFCLGLFVALVEQKWALGAVWALVGIAWTSTAIFFIIPYFRGQSSDTLTRYSWLGSDLTEIIGTLISRPLYVFQHQFGNAFRWSFLAKLLLPVGFLALLAPVTLAVGIPALAINLLSETPSQSSIYFQYISPVIPIIFLATIKGGVKLQNWLGPRLGLRVSKLVIAMILVAGVLVAWILDNPFTREIDDPYYSVYGLEEISNKEAFLSAKEFVPAQAPIATMSAYASHLALRPQLSLFYDRLRLEERRFGFPKEEFLFLHLTDLRWGVNARLFYAAIETAIGRFGYEAIFFDEDVAVLAKTNNPQPATGELLRRTIELNEGGGKYAPTAQSTLDWIGNEWVTSELPNDAVKASARFDSGIRLVGYEAETDSLSPGRPLCVTLYWLTEASVDQSYTAFVHLVDETGYVHAQRDSVPAQGFWPTDKWRQYEVTGDMHCFQIPSHLSDNKYYINVGLYDPVSGERLSIAEGENLAAGDAVQLIEIEISGPK